MALPTLADSDVLDGGAVDSLTSKSFAFQTGDLIVVALRVYQGDSNTVMTGANVSDTVNGTYTLRSHAQHFVGGDPERTDEYIFAFESSAAGNGTVTVNPPGSTAFFTASVSVWRGGTFTYEEQASAVNQTSSPITANITGGVSADYLMVGSGSFEAASSSGWSSNGTVLNTSHASGFGHDISYRTFEASTALSITWTGVSLSGIVEMGFASAAWKFEASASSTLDQEGFRFGVDDGSESAHTWKAAQDTNVTHPLDTNLLLRAILDAAGDPTSFSPALRYQKNGSGGYIPVPVGATTTASVTRFAWAVPAGDPTTSLSVTIPASLPAGSGLVLILNSRDHTSGTGHPTVSDDNGGAAWSRDHSTTDRKMQVWTKRYESGLSSKTLSVSGLVGSGSAVLVVATSVYDSGSFIVDRTEELNSAGNETHAAITPTYAGSMVVFVVWNSNDTLNVASMTASTSGAPDATQRKVSTGGNDSSLDVGVWEDHPASTTGAFTWTQTNGSSYSLAFAIRPLVTTNELYIAPSANIASGGEATTARLTAPSGKTTSNFTTGRRWDDENGSDAIDIEEDEYTEVEWCLRAQDPAEDGDYFDFRVYSGSSPLDGYAVTPRWTLGSGSATYSLTLDPATVAVTGAAVGLRATRRATLDAASLAATMQAIAVRAARRLAVDPASVSVTGAPVTVRVTRRVDLAPASVAVAGQTVAVRVGRRLALAHGTTAIAAADVTLIKLGGYTLALDAASVAVDGADLGVRATRRLALDAAAMVLTGSGLGLERGYRLDAQPAAVTVGGSDLSLEYGRRMVLSASTVALTGAPVTLRATRRLGLEAAVVTLGAGEVGLVRVGSYVLALDPATVSLTGSALRLRAARRAALEAAEWTVTGQGIGLRRWLRLGLDAATVTSTGAVVGLRLGRRVALDAASTSVTAPALALRASRRLPLDAMVVEVTGGSLVFDYSGSLIGIIAMDGAYSPVLSMDGAYTPVVQVEGAYTPTLTMQGAM